MADTGTVEGKVLDTHGKEQPGAEVQIEGTELTGIAGIDGSYRIENVPAGQRRIKASMVLGHQTKDVVVPADGSVAVDFTVRPL
jgi:hypothetical protein